MDNWSVVQSLGDLVQPSALPPRSPSKWAALSTGIAAAGRASLPFRPTVAVLLPNVDLNGEMLLKRGAGVFELSLRYLAKRRPAFVLSGSLDGVCQHFGVDPDESIPVRITTNGLVLLFGTKNGKPVAVHAALSSDQTRSIQQLCVGTTLGAEVLPEYAPTIIEMTRHRMMVGRIDAQSLMPWGGSEQELQNAILLALEPLKILYARRNQRQAPDREYLQSLGAFIDAHPRRKQLSAALHVLKDWDGSALGSVPIHGDYWLNNVLGSRNRVVGVVDWDRARRNGCPGFDALHLGFMSYAMWANKYVSELLASLWTNEWPYAWLAYYTELIGDMFRLSTADIQALASMLWLSYFYHHHADREPQTEWQQNMIEPVCRALSSASAVRSRLYVA